MYTFSIMDGEYILQMNKNLLISEIQKPYEKLFSQLKDLKSSLEYSEKEDNSDLENKIIEVYKKIDFEHMKIIEVSVLFGMFLASIMKHNRENEVKYPIIVFDKTPYYHKTAIENYKGDRYNSSEVSQEIEEKLKDETLSDNERTILEFDKARADYDSKNFWQYQKVKLSLIERQNTTWAEAGIHCLSKRGYEADQLAYYLSTIISKQYEKDKKTNCILLTVDKDWTNFVKPGIIFHSIWSGNLKDRQYNSLTEEWEEFHKQYLYYAKNQKIKDDWKDLTRYDYGILTELFIGSHNNATLFEEQEDDFRDYLIERNIQDLIDKGGKNKRLLKPIAKKMADVELFFRIINGCKNKKFKSYEIMKTAYKAMNVNLGKTVNNGYCKNIGTSYKDDIHDICMSVLKKCNTYKRGTIINLCEEHEISINMMNYSKLVSNLKVIL